MFSFFVCLSTIKYFLFNESKAYKRRRMDRTGVKIDFLAVIAKAFYAWRNKNGLKGKTGERFYEITRGILMDVNFYNLIN